MTKLVRRTVMVDLGRLVAQARHLLEKIDEMEIDVETEALFASLLVPYLIRHAMVGEDDPTVEEMERWLVTGNDMLTTIITGESPVQIH